jgi:hypothetical protein
MKISNSKIALLVGVAYSLVAALTAVVVSNVGGANALTSIPKWIFYLVGPMIPLGIGHGVEFFIVATVLCLPLFVGVVVTGNRALKIILALVALTVWMSIGSFLGQ